MPEAASGIRVSGRPVLTREKTDLKQFILIFIIAFFIYMATQMIGTTIATYADSMGAGAQYIGMITGAFGLMALLPRPISGQIVDKENNKLLMFIVLGFCVVSSGILIFARCPFLLMLSRGIYGLGWGVGSTLCMTSACNTLAEDKMIRGIAIYTLGQTLAMVLGPSAALLIQLRVGYRGLYISSTVLMMIAFLLVFGYKSENKGNRTTRYSFKVKEMFALEAYAPAVMSVCSSLISAGTTAFVLLYAKSRGVENIHWFFTVQAVAILAFRPLLTKFVTEKNLVPVTVVCNVMYIVYLLVMTFSVKWYHFAIAAVIMGAAMAGAQPALMNLCVGAVSPDRRGRATNTNYASYDVGSFLGPYLTGVFSAWLGYDYIFLLMIPAVLIGLFVFCRFYFHHKRV